MAEGSRAALTAMVIAALALVTAAAALWGGGEPDDGARLEALEQRLEQAETRNRELERRVAALAARGSSSSDRDPALAAGGEVPPAGSPSEAATQDQPPAQAERFARLEVPPGAHTVEQLENGAFEVHNEDASRVGEIIEIKGLRDDGSSETITLTLPPLDR